MLPINSFNLFHTGACADEPVKSYEPVVQQERKSMIFEFLNEIETMFLHKKARKI